jgi:hypothetical protein
MTDILNKLRNLLFRQRQQVAMDNTSDSTTSTTDKADDPVITEQTIVALMKQLAEVKSDQYSCADSSALLDEYVDLAADAQEAALLMPLVKAHLDACPDCHQSFEILLNILKADE